MFMLMASFSADSDRSSRPKHNTPLIWQSFTPQQKRTMAKTKRATLNVAVTGSENNSGIIALFSTSWALDIRLEPVELSDGSSGVILTISEGVEGTVDVVGAGVGARVIEVVGVGVRVIGAGVV